MANWIESQLCVTGEKDTVENFKNTFITIDEDGYFFDFDKLFSEFDYVLSKERIEKDELTEDLLNRVLIREDFSPNFDLHYWGCTNYYEYNDKRNKQFRMTSWIEAGYHTREDISIEENCIKLRFTSKDNPPIHSIIHLSKSYPDLDFRLAFYDICNQETDKCSGCIIGKNGLFDGSKFDYGYYHKNSNRQVFQVDFNHWYYSDTGEKVENDYFSPEVKNYLFL